MIDNKISTDIKSILSDRFNLWHFILSFALTSGLAFGLYILVFILGWLCCMESPASGSMFSNWTLFSMFTIELIVLLGTISFFYKKAKERQRLDFCKSYLIIGVLLLVIYLIVTPYSFTVNF